MLLPDGVVTRVQNRGERRRIEKDIRRGAHIPYTTLELSVARALPAERRMRYFAHIDGRDEAPLTFRQWVDRVKPDYLWAPHLIALANVLQDVCDGLRLRVMCFMPPRHGKSELISRLFSAYFLYRWPMRQVALTTYGAELSYELSRNARDNFIVGGGALAGDSSAVKSWHTTEGGNLWATGVGGPATGRGYHLGIIDDPYKDHTEAFSAVTRRSRLQWYRSVFRFRAAPKAAIVILLTRWHQDDLVSNLLREDEVTKQRWHVLEMPAEKFSAVAAADVDALAASVSVQGKRARFPSTVTLEPDARDDVRWLWTERFEVSEYEDIKRGAGGSGGYFWNALWQQRPTSMEGTLFKEAWLKRIPRHQLPPMIGRARVWDLAASDDAGAFTAGLRVEKSREYAYYITALEHGQWAAGKRDLRILSTAKQDRLSGVTTVFPVDPGAAGKQVAQQFVRLLDGITPVVLLPESGSKFLRAQMPASSASNGMLYIVDEPWAEVVIRELLDAGEGAEYWDIVDALSQAYAFLGPIQAEDENMVASHSLRTRR